MNRQGFNESRERNRVLWNQNLNLLLGFLALLIPLAVAIKYLSPKLLQIASIPLAFGLGMTGFAGLKTSWMGLQETRACLEYLRLEGEALKRTQDSLDLQD